MNIIYLFFQNRSPNFNGEVFTCNSLDRFKTFQLQNVEWMWVTFNHSHSECEWLFGSLCPMRLIGDQSTAYQSPKISWDSLFPFEIFFLNSTTHWYYFKIHSMNLSLNIDKPPTNRDLTSEIIALTDAPNSRACEVIHCIILHCCRHWSSRIMDGTATAVNAHVSATTEASANTAPVITYQPQAVNT